MFHLGRPQDLVLSLRRMTFSYCFNFFTELRMSLRCQIFETLKTIVVVLFFLLRSETPQLTQLSDIAVYVHECKHCLICFISSCRFSRAFFEELSGNPLTFIPSTAGASMISCSTAGWCTAVSTAPVFSDVHHRQELFDEV